MMSALIIASIALAVVLGYKTKINTGFFCIAFAYLIGCFMLGMKTKDLIADWPTSTMFVILAVSLFYNFAAVNGTLEKMSSSLLYACRRFPGLLPYALFLVAVVLSVMGAAYFTVLAFLAPITMAICEESKMDKLTGAVAINCGALAGGNFPTAALGVVFRGLIDTAYEADPALTPLDSFSTEMTIFAFAILFSLIPALAVSTGLSPAVLFACTVLGAQSSAISPFSSGGSLILGSYGNDEERNKLFNRLLFVAVPISVCISAVYNFAVAMIL